uniref:Uncharacterized protein n=1 Tax=Romanomermis culicivorax TaxID=13658 RepID=A0A915L3Y3_ROMCU
MGQAEQQVSGNGKQVVKSLSVYFDSEMELCVSHAINQATTSFSPLFDFPSTLGTLRQQINLPQKIERPRKELQSRKDGKKTMEHMRQGLVGGNVRYNQGQIGDCSLGKFAP